MPTGRIAGITVWTCAACSVNRRCNFQSVVYSEWSKGYAELCQKLFQIIHVQIYFFLEASFAPKLHMMILGALCAIFYSSSTFLWDLFHTVMYFVEALSLQKSGSVTTLKVKWIELCFELLCI